MDALTIILGLALVAGLGFAIYSLVKNRKVDMSKIIDIADVAVRYVEQVYKLDTPEKKKDFAIDRVVKALQAMGMKVDSSVIELIDVAIEGAVQKLPKTN